MFDSLVVRVSAFGGQMLWSVVDTWCPAVQYSLSECVNWLEEYAARIDRLTITVGSKCLPHCVGKGGDVVADQEERASPDH